MGHIQCEKARERERRPYLNLTCTGKTVISRRFSSFPSHMSLSQTFTQLSVAVIINFQNKQLICPINYITGLVCFYSHPIQPQLHYLTKCVTVHDDYHTVEEK